MLPVLTHVTWFGMERAIGSYGVMLALALLVASVAFVVLAARDVRDRGALIACVGIVVASSFAGANVLFALVEVARTGELVWVHGHFGLVFFGGALGGALGLWLASRRLAFPFAQMADHGVIALALGQAIGRVGCWLGGCCYGVPWRGLDGHGLLAVTYTHPLAPAADPLLSRVPTPLLEAVLVSLLALVLWRIHSRTAVRIHGRLALHYALGYAMVRFGLEYVRGDNVRGVMFDGLLTTSQLLSIVVVAVASVAMSRMRVRALVVWTVVVWSASVVTIGDARAQLRMQAPAVVQIDAGWFTLGSDDADIEVAAELCRLDADRPENCRAEIFDDERPARRVYVSAYRIDRTEVSNASYRRCVAANICAPQRLSDADPRVSAPEHPVTGVTFGDAVRYCAWLGGALPTEAQWEKGARGANGRRFPWGNLWNSRLANHGRGMGREDPIDGYNYAAPIDAFVDARSPYGLHNMAGNAAEMTLDYYDERGYTEAQRIDPRGPREGSERVVRGGSWRSPALTLRTTHRTHIAEDDTQPDVGFRCSYAP